MWVYTNLPTPIIEETGSRGQHSHRLQKQIWSEVCKAGEENCSKIVFTLHDNHNKLGV
jgi:hypothetical protein